MRPSWLGNLKTLARRAGRIVLVGTEIGTPKNQNLAKIERIEHATPDPVWPHSCNVTLIDKKLLAGCFDNSSTEMRFSDFRTLRGKAITASILWTETIHKRFSSLVRSRLRIRIDRDRAQLYALFKEDSVRRLVS